MLSDNPLRHAWLQGRAPITHIQAMGIEFLVVFSPCTCHLRPICLGRTLPGAVASNRIAQIIQTHKFLHIDQVVIHGGVHPLMTDIFVQVFVCT